MISTSIRTQTARCEAKYSSYNQKVIGQIKPQEFRARTYVCIVALETSCQLSDQKLTDGDDFMPTLDRCRSLSADSVNDFPNDFK